MTRKRKVTDSDFGAVMASIFRTAQGRVLHGRLTEIAMTLSALKPTPAGAICLVDPRTGDVFEGRRWLAIELLGAANAMEEPK